MESKARFSSWLIWFYLQQIQIDPNSHLSTRDPAVQETFSPQCLRFQIIINFYQWNEFGSESLFLFFAMLSFHLHSLKLT